MAEASLVDGLVLAAGGSQRMGGRSKALLRIGEETFIEHAMRVLREGGCRTVYVVAGEDAEVQAAVRAAGAELLVNPDATSQQFDSVKIGMHTLPADSTAVAILPVDCPLVTAATVQTLIDTAARSTKPVVLPMYNGVGGHPVMLRRPFYDTVLSAPGMEGLSGVIIDHGHQIHLLTVTDAGILVDIDTEEEYRRIIGGDDVGSGSGSGTEGGSGSGGAERRSRGVDRVDGNSTPSHS